MSLRFFKSVLQRQRLGQIDMGLGILGIVLQRCFEMFDGFVNSVLLGKKAV